MGVWERVILSVVSQGATGQLTGLLILTHTSALLYLRAINAFHTASPRFILWERDFLLKKY